MSTVEYQRELLAEEIKNSLNLSTALATAINARLMSPDHGGTIWKQFLKTTSFDVVKPPIKNDAKKA